LQFASAINADFWISNFFFYSLDSNYFGPQALDNLFLHTWTLSVEEQFYLVWPAVMLSGLGYFSVMPSAPGSLERVLWFVVYCSLQLSAYWTLNEPSAAFYMMPARGWQFALGGLVASWGFKRARMGVALSARPRWHYELIAALGLTAILLSTVCFNVSMPYPSWRAGLPSIGAVLLLLSGTEQQRPAVSKALSLPPLCWRSNVSYGFYLWHWPLLLFFNNLEPIFLALNRATARLATIMMVAVSYYFVENPLRTHRQLLKLPKLVIGAAVITTGCAFLLLDNFSVVSQG
jgi:peptidoglycan/LPS O-acetylase OafA/YrhL